MDFPSRLRKLRKDKKKTQRELATSLGLTEGAYRAYESGRATPTPRQLEIICSVFGVTLSDLFSGVTIQNDEDFAVLADEKVVPLGTTENSLADEIYKDLYGLKDEQILLIKNMIKALQDQNELEKAKKN